MSMAVCISAPRRSRRRGTSLPTLGALSPLHFIAGFAFLAGFAQAAEVTVTDVKFWSLGDTTRVSVEASGEFRYKWDRLRKPDRLFFDLADSKPAMVQRGEHKIAVGDAFLKQIRIAETKPGVTRVVLDLEDEVEFVSSQLAQPDRLIIELKSVAAKSSPKSESKRATPPAEKTKSTADTKPAAPPPSKEQTAETPRFAPLGPAAPPPASSTSSDAEPLPMLEVRNTTVTPAPAAAPPTTAPAPPATKDLTAAAKTSVPKTPPKKAPDAAPSTPAGPPQAPTRNSNGDRSLTRELGLKLGRIVIDPGHGGHDPGTHGKSGLLEKDLVLDVSKRLAKLLEEKLDAEVLLTRTDDTFIALEDRVAMANKAKADLFLSIHANSNPSRAIAGIETYYLNFSASREDLDLATRENATARSTIAELQDVVSKIALRAKVDESREFAVQLHSSLNSAAKSKNKEAKERPVKKAPFVVLIGAEMPSVLAEIGYLSNTREEEMFQGAEYRDVVAQALLDGVMAYMKTLGQGPVASALE